MRGSPWLSPGRAALLIGLEVVGYLVAALLLILFYLVVLPLGTVWRWLRSLRWALQARWDERAARRPAGGRGAISPDRDLGTRRAD